MSNDFNPYTRWFDIPLEAQPPNHYVLLGLALYESNEAAIERATERRLVFLQDVANGPHTKDSQRLLNEVAAARLCLTDASKKSNYDQMLQLRLSSPVAAVQPPAIQNEALWQTKAAVQAEPARVPRQQSDPTGSSTGGRAGLNIRIQENSANPAAKQKILPRKTAAKKDVTSRVPAQDSQAKTSPFENPIFVRNLLIGGAVASVLMTVIAIAIFFSGAGDQDLADKSAARNPASTKSQSGSPFAQSKFTGGSRTPPGNSPDGQANSDSAAVSQNDVTRKGLVVWLDASDRATLELNQGRVKIWKDKSGRRFDAVQDNAGNQPQLKTDALRGKPAVILVKPAYLSLESTQPLKLSDDYTIATMAWSDAGVLLGKGLPHKQDAPSAFSLYNGASRFRTSKSKYLEAQDDDPKKWKVRIAVADQKSFWWYVDGLNERLAGDRHSITSSEPLVIGRRLDQRSPEYANGAIAELLIYNRAISDVERKQLEAYLTEKWLK